MKRSKQAVPSSGMILILGIATLSQGWEILEIGSIPYDGFERRQFQ